MNFELLSPITYQTNKLSVVSKGLSFVEA